MKIERLYDGPSEKRRDRSLSRLALDLEDLLEACGAEEDAEWFNWAERQLNFLNLYFLQKYRVRAAVATELEEKARQA